METCATIGSRAQDRQECGHGGSVGGHGVHEWSPVKNTMTTVDINLASSQYSIGSLVVTNFTSIAQLLYYYIVYFLNFLVLDWLAAYLILLCG